MIADNNIEDVSLICDEIMKLKSQNTMLSVLLHDDINITNTGVSFDAHSKYNSHNTSISIIFPNKNMVKLVIDENNKLIKELYNKLKK